MFPTHGISVLYGTHQPLTLVPMLGNYKPQILIRVGTTLCFSYSRELEESRWRALFNLLNIFVMLIMIIK